MTVEQDGMPYDRLTLAVGNEEQPPGRTEVELDASGRVTAVTTYEGKSDRAVADIGKERAATLIQQTANALQAERHRERKGLPGEPLYEITLWRGDAVAAEAVIWRSDLESDERFNRLVTALEHLSSTPTDGLKAQ